MKSAILSGGPSKPFRQHFTWASRRTYPDSVCFSDYQRTKDLANMICTVDDTSVELFRWAVAVKRQIRSTLTNQSGDEYDWYTLLIQCELAKLVCWQLATQRNKRGHNA